MSRDDGDEMADIYVIDPNGPPGVRETSPAPGWRALFSGVEDAEPGDEFGPHAVEVHFCFWSVEDQDWVPVQSPANFVRLLAPGERAPELGET